LDVLYYSDAPSLAQTTYKNKFEITTNPSLTPSILVVVLLIRAIDIDTNV